MAMACTCGSGSVCFRVRSNRSCTIETAASPQNRMARIQVVLEQAGLGWKQ